MILASSSATSVITGAPKEESPFRPEEEEVGRDLAEVEFTGIARAGMA